MARWLLNEDRLRGETHSSLLLVLHPDIHSDLSNPKLRIGKKSIHLPGVGLISHPRNTLCQSGGWLVLSYLFPPLGFFATHPLISPFDLLFVKVVTFPTHLCSPYFCLSGSSQPTHLLNFQLYPLAFSRGIRLTGQPTLYIAALNPGEHLAPAYHSPRWLYMSNEYVKQSNKIL